MTMRIALVSALMFAAPVAAQTVSTPWLEGCWAEGASQESWVRLRDGTLLGTGMIVRDNGRRVTERLRIEADRDRLTYIAEPVGQQRTRFAATAVNGDSMVVANLVHDFPQTISYRRFGRDTLRVALAGVEGGSPRAMQMTFVRRPDCAAIGEVGVGLVPDGSTIRLQIADDRVTGKMLALTSTSVTLRRDDTSRDVPLDAILGVERRRRSAGRGALIGGAIGAAAFTGFLHLIISALCESTEGCQGDHNRAWGYGLVLGGAGGGLLGAGVGSLIPRWERVVP